MALEAMNEQQQQSCLWRVQHFGFFAAENGGSGMCEGRRLLVGWMDGWMDGWMGLFLFLEVAFSSSRLGWCAL